MSKPDKILVPGKKYYAWQYEEQTQVKHKVLSAYSKIWVSKLGFKTNTLFFDCHGGCGAYIDANGNITYGSSILVKRIADEVNKTRSSKTGVYYCETDNKNFNNFKEILNDNGSPKIVAFNESFESVIQRPDVSKYYTQFPTLFFVDPFGFNFSINNLSKLMTTFGNEIIVNFMFDFINRFISVDSIEESYNNFFGSDKWKLANDMGGQAREDYLVRIFKEKLKEVTGAKYVFAYRLYYPHKNQTYYYLIHATNHIDGITLMKSSFASVNNGRVQYLGKNNDNLSFMDLDFYKSEEIYSSFLLRYQGQRLTFEKIWSDIVEDIAYTNKDLSDTLVQLEKTGRVSLERVTSKRGTYKKDDIVCVL